MGRAGRREGEGRWAGRREGEGSGESVRVGLRSPDRAQTFKSSTGAELRITVDAAAFPTCHTLNLGWYIQPPPPLFPLDVGTKLSN